MIAIQTFLRRIVLIAFFGITIHSASAFAYYEFTYTGPLLPFTHGTIDGFPSADLGNSDYPAWFSISFESTTKLSATAPTTFTMTSPTANSSAGGTEWFAIKPESSGYIVVNPDGLILNWDLNLLLFRVPTNREEEVTNSQLDLLSSGGTVGCNCDELIYRYTVAVQRPYEQWVPAATLAFHHQAVSASSNWIMTEKVSVPEPGPVVLFAVGLSLIGFFRHRKSK